VLKTLLQFISEFLHGSNDQFILVILVLMIFLFSVITVILFIITVYLRISHTVKLARDHHRSKIWDPIILSVMDDSMGPKEAYKKLKWRNSIEYLLHLELYIDMLKGKEKERLISLGKLSLRRLHNLLQSRNRKKQLYGVHLIGIFHPSDQYKFLRYNSKDELLTLTMIREMRTIDNFRIKEKLIQMLFLFKYISPIYMSNILVEMGSDIIPILKMLILKRHEHPYEQIIAIETLRRMHYTECQELAGNLLQNTDHPMVLTSFLRYLEDIGDEKLVSTVKPYLSHSHIQVRLAAVNTYISLCRDIEAKEIINFFNDSSVNIAVTAANRLKLAGMIPYIDLEQIEKFKWADIYKRMVF